MRGTNFDPHYNFPKKFSNRLLINLRSDRWLPLTSLQVGRICRAELRNRFSSPEAVRDCAAC